MKGLFNWLKDKFPALLIALLFVTLGGLILAIFSNNAEDVEFGKSAFLVFAIALMWGVTVMLYKSRKI